MVSCNATGPFSKGQNFRDARQGGREHRPAHCPTLAAEPVQRLASTEPCDATQGSGTSGIGRAALGSGRGASNFRLTPEEEEEGEGEEAVSYTHLTLPTICSV
eukprot:5746663-Alexandrium_andersonii.AAC.1